MSRVPARRAARLPGRTLPIVALSVALLLTLVSTAAFAASARANDALRFEREVQQTRSGITARIETYTSLLRGAAGLFAASDAVTAAQFRAYVDQLGLGSRYPGIQGIGFAARVAPAGEAALVESLRGQGLADFAIWPEQPLAERFPIVFLEPLDRRNRAALGYDMFSEPTRRAAMELARDSGQPVASARVTLVQEIDPEKQAGFLIYMPVYRGGAAPASLAERRERLLGFVYSPFRAGDLMASIFVGQADPLVTVEIYDGEVLAPAHLLYRSHPDADEGPSFSARVPLTVAGRQWTAAYRTHPDFSRAQASMLVPFLGVGGVLISLLLFALVQAQVRAREQAEAAVRARDTFFSVASHELKTPITTLLGNAQLLQRRAARDGTLPDRDQRALEVMADQARRLNRLVGALLDHSRLQSGRLTIERAAVDLAALTRQVVDETRPSLGGHTIELQAPESPVTVTGDELRLGQVLHNLLSNAIRYSPAGGPIEVRVAAVAGAAEVSVSDSGVGIPAAALPHLFEQFYRAANADASSATGMGLGLYVVREIVQQHGGTVAVQSAEGRGSCFTVRIPLAPLDLLETKDQRPRTTSG